MPNASLQNLGLWVSAERHSENPAGVAATPTPKGFFYRLRDIKGTPGWMDLEGPHDEIELSDPSRSPALLSRLLWRFPKSRFGIQCYKATLHETLLNSARGMRSSSSSQSPRWQSPRCSGRRLLHTSAMARHLRRTSKSSTTTSSV